MLEPTTTSSSGHRTRARADLRLGISGHVFGATDGRARAVLLADTFNILGMSSREGEVKHRMASGMLIGVTAPILFSTACSEKTASAPMPAPPNAAFALTSMTSCGASFRMIAQDYDELMAPYGIATTTDTVDVCETWTGSDYQYQAVGVGSSDDVPEKDAVQSLTYSAGNLTGYDISGAESAPASEVGPTSFDFMYADQSTRQASYDYPYYGVASPGCPQTCAIQTSLGSNSDLAGPADAFAQYTRHGLTRLGVRAIVDASEEISRSPGGDRRFRATRGSETILRTVDPRTELIMTETWSTPADTIVTRHTWKRVAGGYVRERSESEIVETVAGRKVRGRSLVVFKGVQVRDPKFPPIGLEVTP